MFPKTILMATLFRMGNKARKREKYFHMHDMHAREIRRAMLMHS